MLNYDYLVNSIVDELYKKINDLDISVKPKAVVLWPNNKEELETLKDRFEVAEFSDETRDCDIVVVSRLCMRGLCNLASGNSTSVEERFILKMLMKGKKVFVLHNNLEYKRYKSTAPKALYNKYVEYEDEICKYGIKLVEDLSCITLDKDVRSNKSNIEKCIAESPVKYIDSAKENIAIKSLDLSAKKLISESDLRKYRSEDLQELIVNKKSIITPLASDFVRVHHLNLIRV
jgi:ethanolamine utilization protein